ncbi:MAG: glutamyl-tRNA reductase [Opitutaceae bacterium]|jgi:glutamyl-tRNA reductase|nr:glutamyl-tRNA reductase [Opitutaceae bacterium]
MSTEPTTAPAAQRPAARPTPASPSAPAPSAPALFCVGISHHTAPLELREHLALPPGKLDALHARLATIPGLREIVILNTCNRVEFYGVAGTPACNPTGCNPPAVAAMPAAAEPSPPVAAASPAAPTTAAPPATLAPTAPTAAGNGELKSSDAPVALATAPPTPPATDATPATDAPVAATVAAVPAATTTAAPLADAIGRLEAEFCALQHIPAESFRAIRRRAHGPDALRHLLDVSAGLDSQMLGETEILGQVKDAYAAAQRRRTAGPVLNRVFQKTFQHAKYIRTHTAITEGVISTANIAVELALKIFGRLDRVRVLLLGAGEIAEKNARAFQSRGAVALTVASRTFERALALARRFHGAALPLENVPLRLADYDIVVCSTAAPGAVITRETAASAMRARRTRPLFFIDLALPRDVAPSVADLENVFIYNLDDLARIAGENRAARAAEVAKAKDLARQKSARLWNQISRAPASAPALAAPAPAPGVVAVDSMKPVSQPRAKAPQ